MYLYTLNGEEEEVVSQLPAPPPPVSAVAFPRHASPEPPGCLELAPHTGEAAMEDSRATDCNVENAIHSGRIGSIKTRLGSIFSPEFG